MHSGRPPNRDLFDRVKGKGTLSWLLPRGETGVIHTYQQTIENPEAETEGVVVVDIDSVTQCLHIIYIIFQIKAVVKVHSHPD